MKISLPLLFSNGYNSQQFEEIFFMNFKRIFSGVVLMAALTTACNTWERNTYNTLASSQAVINGARADYESAKIPQTKCAYAIINDATAADTAAVSAMVVYEQLKANKGNATAQEGVVNQALTTLAPLVVDITSLVSNPTAKCGNAAAQ